ncbi:hypothetical protein GH714_024634 [Hevea brasiliensis]|uniref:PRONE domain-containing protein n=1 Tax=Hevea brasiliensis TaxID=3981 RepID=A0A6A6LR61_HEVBR|nr:hypothetical protein GH714_024634 [Hevea brasiliensis]
MPSPRQKGPSAELELMKERFAKLLLGEDMSGGGKGVSSALALSNAITNLAAFIFGEQKRLEPMNPERKTRWRKEIDWLLSVTDHIVEFVPSQQSKDGINTEIMVTRQRSDLLMNIPALRKLDTILIDQLDQFGNQKEFWYVSRDREDSEQGTPPRNDDKWWIPTVKDIGQAILESYSRIIESLAFTILSKIEDILYSDSLTQSPKSESNGRPENEKPEEETDKFSPAETPTATSLTLSDFMGWNVDDKKNNFCNIDDKPTLKPIATKRFSYLEKLESLTLLRSPASRH